MKKQLFVLVVLFLMACSGGKEKHNLTGFKQTDENNTFILNSIEQNVDYLYSSSLMPGMNNVVKPFLDRCHKILEVSSALCNNISNDINAIMKEHNVSIDTFITANRFDFYYFGSEEVKEPNNFFYGRGEWMCAEMEKFFNELLGQMDITYKGETYENHEYYKRPERAMRLYKYELKIRQWNGRKGLEKLVPLLLIPQKNEEGKSSAEAMFTDLSMIQTLEKLNLMRQRVLMACDIALESVRETLYSPEYNFNKVEPVAYISPARKDSAKIYVFTIAYDSTEVPTVRYMVDGGADRETRKPYIVVPNYTREISGLISVRERGVLKWKPWIYRFK